MPVPVIDLAPWHAGDETARAAVAAQVDAALRTAGFFLITGHGVLDGLRAQVRAQAREFFALPSEVKKQYADVPGGRGWLPPGAEADGQADGGESPPDMKESFVAGADRPCGDPQFDGYFFQPNVYPGEVLGLESAVAAYLAPMRALAEDLLAVCDAALGIEPGFLAARVAGHPAWYLNLNRYPPLTETGAPEPGQFRIGPHTDFGTITVLDREPGRGGLQIWTKEDGWEDAPWVPGAFTVNAGDLLALWSGGRWIAGRHRVLPPQASSPDEDLMSLVYFFEGDPRAVVGPLSGGEAVAPVVAGQYVRERLDAIIAGKPVRIPDPVCT